MVFIVSVAQQKGGAGKTTLAAHLATAFWQRGKKVAMIDADPQASLTRWFQERQEKHPDKAEGMTFAQVAAWRVTSEISRLRRNHEIIIIDNASGLDMDTRANMRNADLVVVPVQPSPADVWATEAVTELAKKEGYKLLLVMNRVTARTRLAGIFQKKLPRLSDTQIGNRVAYAAVLQDGLTVMEEAPRSSAAHEVDLLVKEVMKFIPKPQKRGNGKSGMEILRESATIRPKKRQTEPA